MNGKPRTVRSPALTGRAIAVAREAYRDAVARMQRLAGRDDAREPADQEPAAKEQTEKADTDLAQERARTYALERQLAARADRQKLLAQELARNEELEQRLAAHPDERKLLAEVRARNQELEKQLAARGDEQQLLMQQRARHHVLEQQLATDEEEQKLLEQKRARNRELALQLSIRQNGQKLVARERARGRELEQRLAAFGDEQRLLAHDRARPQDLEKQQSISQGGRKLVAPETPGHLEAGPRPAEAPLPFAPPPLWQYKSKILVVSGVLLLLFAGAAGYAVFSSPSLDTITSQTAASQTAAQAVAPPARSIPVAGDLVRVGARAAEEANRRDAPAQRQAEEQRLADAAAAKAAEEEERFGAESGEADLRMTTGDRQKLQVALSALGFDVGRIDGTFGPRTRRMIGAWQVKFGDISTGFLTAAQKKALLSQGAPAVAVWEDEQKRIADEKQRRAIAVQYLPPPDWFGPLVAGQRASRD
jgi:Putative peptidoglycan binding domain